MFIIDIYPINIRIPPEMKNILALLFCTCLVSAQPLPVKVADVSYQVFPYSLRTENSGIYAISTFTVSERRINLLSTDGQEEFAVENSGALSKLAPTSENHRSVFSAESYLRGSRSLIDNRDGTYSDALGTQVSLKIAGRSTLMIASNISGEPTEIRLAFPGDLGYAELIGVDASGHTFLLTERYRTEIPLMVKREVVTLDSAGKRLSVLEIPDIKYITTDKDFRIDAEGNLYHMMTTADRMIVFRWPDLTVRHSDPIVYPAEYAYSLHYNTLLPTAEAAGGPIEPQPAALIRRTLALRIGESYAMHQYPCTAKNLSPTNVTAPDGDVVRTPPWLLAGANARIPYMWGGFSTIAQFDAGLHAGYYAGDINTSGVSSYSVGLDCSGFVSRCWQMSSHYSTSMMPSITTQYASWDSLKPGDAILKNGHVRLFIERSANGGFRVVEAAGRNWDVSYYTFALSDLQGVYTPRRYNSMEQNYSFQRPMLTSVITGGNAGATLTWDCDTTGLIGYRIYSSADGVQWNLLANESMIGRVLSTVLPPSADAEYYRIATVKNDAAGTESDWSNAMGASRDRGPAHYLIIDGFERLTGSWQSAAHSFAVRYGNALKKAGVTFSTMKNFRATTDTAAFGRYDGVIWFLGDEGTEQETFSDREQALLRSYLEKGKKLFLSGSEVGWDLSQNGMAADKEFYSNYLKAAFKSDNASSSAVKNEAGGFYGDAPFTIGQVYVEDYPDAIDSANGSTVCLRYDNNTAAGVQYAGTFGASHQPGKLIYLSFALETAADDAAVNSVIKNAITFFEGTTTGIVSRSESLPLKLQLQQNYPNPFNPSTTLAFTVPSDGHATLTIFNALGQKVAVIFNGEAKAGSATTVWFNAAGLASGVYFSRLEYAGKTLQTKMQLLK